MGTTVAPVAGSASWPAWMARVLKPRGESVAMWSLPGARARVFYGRRGPAAGLRLLSLAAGTLVNRAFRSSPQPGLALADLEFDRNLVAPRLHIQFPGGEVTGVRYLSTFEGV